MKKYNWEGVNPVGYFLDKLAPIGIAFLFFYKQKTAYEIEYGLLGSEMCIRDSAKPDKLGIITSPAFQVRMIIGPALRRHLRPGHGAFRSC